MSDHPGHPDSLCAHLDERLSWIEQWSSDAVQVRRPHHRRILPRSRVAQPEPNELVPFKAADVDLFVSVLDEVLSCAW
jgi:hypothetical protein